MFDHVEFGVSSFEKSFKFYSSCLTKLGYQLLFSDEKSKCFGFGSQEWTEFLLTEESSDISENAHCVFERLLKHK